MTSKSKYVTISLPTGISDEIDELIDELGYWPSRGAFVREACLTKIREERRRLRELREAKGDTIERSEP
jgi:Arc/MetJ-type ribon-helix-helix transcriptional regulator